MIDITKDKILEYRRKEVENNLWKEVNKYFIPPLLRDSFFCNPLSYLPAMDYYEKHPTPDSKGYSFQRMIDIWFKYQIILKNYTAILKDLYRDCLTTMYEPLCYRFEDLK